MNGDGEVIIKNRINETTMGSICVLVFLGVISFVAFKGFLDQGSDAPVGLLVVGIICLILFLLVFPSLIKRDYLKLNNQGISISRVQMSYVRKEELISWNRMDAIVGPDVVVTINEKEIQESELNAESISKLDKFKGVTPDDYEGEAEWLENGIYLFTKKDNNVQPEIYEIGSMLNNYKIDIETIKKMWINSLNN